MTGRIGILSAAAFALILVTGCGRYGPLVRPIPTTPAAATPAAPAAEAEAPDPEEPADETVSPEGGFHEGDDEE